MTDLEYWHRLQIELADIEALGDHGDCCDDSYRGYHCTRIKGHPGIHAAGGIRGKVEQRWSSVPVSASGDSSGVEVAQDQQHQTNDDHDHPDFDEKSDADYPAEDQQD